MRNKAEMFKLMRESEYKKFLLSKHVPIEFHTRKSARLHAKKFSGEQWVLLQYATIERFST